MNFRTALIAVAFAIAGQTALADTLLFSKQYRLRANEPYETSFYIVHGAPARANSIYLTQAGSQYCNIKVEAVEFVPDTRSVAMQAIPVGTNAVYNIPGGVIYAINIKFHQESWDRVDCTLNAFVGQGGGTDPNPTDVLLGAVSYSGGFNNALTLPVSSFQSIRAIVPKIPAFCGTLDVLGVGTVIGGVYYPAQLSRDGSFDVQAGAGMNVESIRLAINGPRNASCDIPVFVRY